MKKIFLILSLIMFGTCANCDVIRFYNTKSPSKKEIKVSNESNNAYFEDLNMVERGIFGRIYPSDAIDMRLNRIERRMFNRIYPSMSTAQRMNNIIANYESGTGYCGNMNMSLKDRLINSFIGQPTGFTPSIYPSPYVNSYGPSYTSGTYGTNGWRYNNVSRPMMSGAGIHILD